MGTGDGKSDLSPRLAAFDAATVGMMVVDRQGHIREVNDYVTDVFQHDRGALVGRPVSDLVPMHVDHDRHVAAFFLSPARRQMGPDRRVEGVRSDGSTVHLEVGLSPAGRHQVVVTIVDITARRAAEDAQRKLEEELVVTRRRDALARLACGIAHDFNNLMMAMQASVANLQELVGHEPRVDEEASFLAETVTRGSSLTSQLLAFGGSQLLDPKPHQIRSVVESLQNIIARACGPRIEVEMSFDERACVCIDRGQLEQIVMNLVLNARDAMPNGGRLRVATNVQPRSRMAVLTVADTGPGIEPVHLAHVFDPFFTTKGSRGTGLGLAAVNGIVTQVHGTIEVTSSEAGTAFTVRLPLHEGEPAPTSDHDTDDDRTSFEGLEILLVEDDPAVLRGLERVLARAGFVVHTARSGEDALAHPIESLAACITDIVLPGMDGSVVAERLRELRRDLPIVFISGYPSDTVASLPRTGQSAYLQKPFRPPELLRLLGRVIIE